MCAISEYAVKAVEEAAVSEELSLSVGIVGKAIIMIVSDGLRMFGLTLKTDQGIECLMSRIRSFVDYCSTYSNVNEISTMMEGI